MNKRPRGSAAPLASAGPGCRNQGNLIPLDTSAVRTDISHPISDEPPDVYPARTRGGCVGCFFLVFQSFYFNVFTSYTLPDNKKRTRDK